MKDFSQHQIKISPTVFSGLVCSIFVGKNALFLKKRIDLNHDSETAWKDQDKTPPSQ